MFARDVDVCRGRMGSLSGRRRCRGRRQADHILKSRVLLNWQRELLRRLARGLELSPGQMRFAQLDPDEIVADARNGWILCADGHHSPKDQKAIKVLHAPLHFWRFVADFDLWPVVDREMPSAERPTLQGHGNRAEGTEPLGRPFDWIRR